MIARHTTLGSSATGVVEVDARARRLRAALAAVLVTLLILMPVELFPAGARAEELPQFKVTGRYMTALTFGNVHGVYKPGNVKLRPEILKHAQEAVVAAKGLGEGERPFDLVFHGGSGSTAEEIGAAGVLIEVVLDVDRRPGCVRDDEVQGVFGERAPEIARPGHDELRPGRDQAGLPLRGILARRALDTGQYVPNIDLPAVGVQHLVELETIPFGGVFGEQRLDVAVPIQHSIERPLE